MYAYLFPQAHGGFPISDSGVAAYIQVAEGAIEGGAEAVGALSVDATTDSVVSDGISDVSFDASAWANAPSLSEGYLDIPK